jgi:hypothetical protein
MKDVGHNAEDVLVVASYRSSKVVTKKQGSVASPIFIGYRLLP